MTGESGLYAVTKGNGKGNGNGGATFHGTCHHFGSQYIGELCDRILDGLEMDIVAKRSYIRR